MAGQGESIICDHAIRAHKLCLGLNDILMFINSSNDIDEILEKVVEASSEALGCESARIAMREGDNWVIRYVSNLPDDLLGRSFTDNELPHAVLAMETKQPVAIDDALQDDRTNTETMKALGIRSVLVLPLLEKDVVTGTLLYGYHAKAASFTDTEIDYARRMATGVAIALLDARQHQDLRESEKLGNALNEIDTVLFSTKDYAVIMDRMLQLATEAIGAETGVIFSKEGDRWIVRNEYKLPVSLIGQNFSNTEVMHTAITADTKRSLVVQDVVNSPDVDQKFVEMLGIRSLLDFPLIAKGEVIGDLTFHYHSSPVPFNERQVEFARKLQIAISLALENAQLRDAAKQSEESLLQVNRELEAFNYTVAHDLRKPLTIINGYAQVLMEVCSDTLDEQCKDYLRKTYTGTLHMNRLITALLNFSQLAHAEPKHDRVNLSGICEEVAAELKLAEPERQVTFRITSALEAEADSDLLGIVMNNLFGNAWKYTSSREEGIIEFGATESDGTQAYFVRDNGIGFDPAEADRIFAPFQRLATGKEIGGLGIGLATVARIIQRHGGRVWAEGEPEKGATIYFTLQA